MALVDTEVDISLISNPFVSKLGLSSEPFNRKINFAVGGKSHHRQANVQISIPKGNMGKQHEFIIMKDLRHDVILGIDPIKALELSLNIEDESIFFPNGSTFKYADICEAVVCREQKKELMET